MSPLERQDLRYLVFAYTALFVLMFGFLYRMLQSTRHLEQELGLLRTEYREEEDTDFRRGREAGAPDVTG
ncbi:MAG: hypothetical protein M0Z54_13850 [Thermaerobacter sp.]|nr:hypothetical protein [Thermaerobacter sp.]